MQRQEEEDEDEDEQANGTCLMANEESQ